MLTNENKPWSYIRRFRVKHELPVTITDCRSLNLQNVIELYGGYKERLKINMQKITYFFLHTTYTTGTYLHSLRLLAIKRSFSTV